MKAAGIEVGIVEDGPNVTPTAVDAGETCIVKGRIQDVYSLACELAEKCGFGLE